MAAAGRLAGRRLSNRRGAVATACVLTHGWSFRAGGAAPFCTQLRWLRSTADMPKLHWSLSPRALPAAAPDTGCALRRARGSRRPLVGAAKAVAVAAAGKGAVAGATAAAHTCKAKVLLGAQCRALAAGPHRHAVHTEQLQPLPQAAPTALAVFINP